MNILDIQINYANDADATSIREYLKTLLTTLWLEGEGFSGKRPFGNSCWEDELYKALIDAKVVPGKIDDDGYISQFSESDKKKADKLILNAIRDL